MEMKELLQQDALLVPALDVLTDVVRVCERGSKLCCGTCMGILPATGETSRGEALQGKARAGHFPHSAT